MSEMHFNLGSINSQLHCTRSAEVFPANLTFEVSYLRTLQSLVHLPGVSKTLRKCGSASIRGVRGSEIEIPKKSFKVLIARVSFQ